MTPLCAGFDPKRTFIFSDFEYMGGEFYKNCARIAKVCLPSVRLSRQWCLIQSHVSVSLLSVLHIQPGARHLWIRGRVEHRPDWLPTHPGGALVSGFIPAHVWRR